jgi:hypothetical protein
MPHLTTHRTRRKKIHSGLMLALQAAAHKYDGGKQKSGSTLAKGAKYLAEGLGCYPQAIYNWTYVPRNRVMMVHRLTGVPLAALAPELFGGQKKLKGRKARPHL